MNYLFSNMTILTMDDERPILENAYLMVKDGKIAYIGNERPEGFTGEEIKGNRNLLMPGLINAHTHVPMTLLRGYADDYTLDTWLNEYIFPAEDRLDGRSVKAGVMLGIAEMLASGTTSFSDMYFFCNDILECVSETGIKANISRSVTCFDDNFDFNTHEGCAEQRDICRNWHNSDNGRIMIDASIHAEYTSSMPLWKAVADYAHENELGLQVHLSETQAEHEECIQRHGVTPAEVLDRAGVWEGRSVAAHCVWLSDSDIELLARKKVTAAHNPVSNLKLASGIAPAAKMLKCGVNVALATDGMASNNSHDMFEEIKMATILAKARDRDPLAMVGDAALKMATCAGAVAQGRQRECGMLREGMDADIIMLDMNKPHLVPINQIISNIIYSACGSDVVMTMVRGRILYRDGVFTTIDIEKVITEVENYGVPRIRG